MQAERTLNSRRIYDGRLIKLRVDEVELAPGKTATREIVEHPGAVAILAFTADDELVMVRQYRKAAERLTVELPAGTLGPGEDPLACAARELKEETGFAAGTLDRISSFYSAVGFCTEVLHLYVGHELTAGSQEYEDDEDIEVLTVPVGAALDMIRDGTIVDSKTVAGVYWAQLFLNGQVQAA